MVRMSKESRHTIRPRILVAILDATIRLFNIHSGVTMSEIARATDVGRATLHRHFASKSDLLRKVSARCLEEMNASVLATDIPEGPAVEWLCNMLKSAIPLGDRYAFPEVERMEDEDSQTGY